MNTYRMLKLFRRHANYLNNQYRKLRPDDEDDADADLGVDVDYYAAYWEYLYHNSIVISSFLAWVGNSFNKLQLVSLSSCPVEQLKWIICPGREEGSNWVTNVYHH